MRIWGKISTGEEIIGNFFVDDEGRIVVNLDKPELSIENLLRWTLVKRQHLEFIPLEGNPDHEHW